MIVEVSIITKYDYNCCKTLTSSGCAPRGLARKVTAPTKVESQRQKRNEHRDGHDEDLVIRRWRRSITLRRRLLITYMTWLATPPASRLWG